MTAITSAKNLTTHVALVLDRSVSMDHLERKTIQVADELVAFLASKSQEMGQEWRVSVYTFGSEVDCHIWDMDVLRLPSMKEHYRINGNTALIDATNLAIDDGEKITEHRGDHAFLVYVITDGEENWSTGGQRTNNLYGRPSYGAREQLTALLKERLRKLPDNRTVAVLAPTTQGAEHSKKLGFENIFLWDTSSEAGLEAASQAIQTSATTYMEARTQGVAGLRSMKKGLFVGGNLDAKSIKAANLKPLHIDDYAIVPVPKGKLAFEKVVSRTKARGEEKGWFVEIEPFVNLAHPPFRVGKAYYELVKSERIQGNKRLAVVEKKTGKVFVGDGVRQLLGLPEETRTVKPDFNTDYTLFVQSTSTNRHLPIGSQVLVLTK